MTRTETLFVGTVLLITWTFAFINFQEAEVKAHDIQRKNDLKHIAAALNDYRGTVRGYPAATDGKILACGDEFKTVCLWGQNAIVEPQNPDKAYISPLPQDPSARGGHDYTYMSDGRNFQIYASLERRSDDEYNESIIKRSLLCGKKICNFGVGSSNDLPLDRDLESLTNE
ncbi:MAG: hypothetical protein Q7S60_05245 [bacterium]|nr:hypothetical protein [bacterium]